MFHLRYLGALVRYLVAVDNSRERSAWSDAVAEQIRAERAVLHWTQKQVYEAANVARSTYLRLEKGSRVADSTQLARLCGVYGIPISEFFRRVEQRHPEEPTV